MAKRRAQPTTTESENTMPKGNTTKGPRPRYEYDLTFEPVESIPSATRGDTPTSKAIQGFLDSGAPKAKVPVPDVPGLKLGVISGNLSSFVKRHNLPVRVRTAAGAVWLERTTEDNGEAPEDEEASTEGEFELPQAPAEGVYA